jgi:ubiquinone/menaquinone biosynthesis C-methylase UbiE
MTIGFAEILSKGHVVGVDASDQVVKKAEALAQSKGVTNATFKVENAYDLSYPDHFFDVVHCHALLIHLADPVKAVRFAGELFFI